MNNLRHCMIFRKCTVDTQGITQKIPIDPCKERYLQQGNPPVSHLNRGFRSEGGSLEVGLLEFST